MKHLLVMLYLLCQGCLLCAQSAPKIPGIHQFIKVDHEPQVLNLETVKDMIGFPLEAYKQGVNGKVYCRILVSDQGKYLRHTITRSDDPLLAQAVSEELPKLHFRPAMRSRQSIAYWTNLVFEFHRNDIRHSYRKNPLYTQRRTFFVLGKKRISQHLLEGDQAFRADAMDKAEASFTLCIALIRHRKKRIGKRKIRDLYLAYRKRALVYRQRGNWQKADQDLTEASWVMRKMQAKNTGFASTELVQLRLERARVQALGGQLAESFHDINCLRIESSLSGDMAVETEALKVLVLAGTGREEMALQRVQQLLNQYPDSECLRYAKASVMLDIQAVEPGAELLRQLADQDGASDYQTAARQQLKALHLQADLSRTR
ncbi:MAG: energy transducer TonB [Bacteroidota bacterium]